MNSEIEINLRGDKKVFGLIARNVEDNGGWGEKHRITICGVELEMKAVYMKVSNFPKFNGGTISAIINLCKSPEEIEAEKEVLRAKSALHEAEHALKVIRGEVEEDYE